MLVKADVMPVVPVLGRDRFPQATYEYVFLHGVYRLSTTRSVDTSRIWDILKEEIGKLPTKVEPVGERRGGEELSG
jgi:hypothetical protein